MVPPTPNSSPVKNGLKNLFGGVTTVDEKEMEEEPDDQESPNLIHLRSASSRPITPAKFLENMSRSKLDERRDGDVPVFSLGSESASPSKHDPEDQEDGHDKEDKEVDSAIMAPVWDKQKEQKLEFEDGKDISVETQTLDSTLAPILDKEKIENISKMFELDGDGVEKLLLESQIPINSASYATTDEEAQDEEAQDSENEEPAAGTITKETVNSLKSPKTPKSRKWVTSLDAYIPQKFQGVDVKKWSEWTKCMDFSKQNGIVVVEVYSVVFGPSNAMYPFIAEIVNQRADCVKFVRLSLHTMSTMEVVHDTIKDHQHYYPSPEPMFLIIKNGKQMGQLKGTKPAELSTLIEKHVTMQQRAATAPVSPVSVKYRSILKRKSPEKRTSSSMFQTPRKQVPVTVMDHGENIRNLLRASNSGWMSCGSEHSSPTKLWKNEMVLVD